MLNRLLHWLKRFFQRLFGKKQTSSSSVADVQKEPAPPLSDTDLEFLFSELLEGVHQARGQAWALKWLHNIEHRISTERWLEWLQRFSEKLLASSAPNNELASRMVDLGELEVGEVGDAAYDIGMQLLTRNVSEPVWEYDGPDAVKSRDAITLVSTPGPEQTNKATSPAAELENPPKKELSTDPAPAAELETLPEEELQTVTLDELFVMLQQDEKLRQEISQQLGIETDDPQLIVQELFNQFQAANQ
ncbi:hypothetical protein NIES4075_17820 [Tolypothrix sp. NIES-4075]|uniref:hypothetical protein n=1 Tax=Tolypothrix sp. NIES-4075 TaxID=2005459 RepID=UPI000B5D06F1|nr:hypothetical protein [Tolypothrix sp. NIES-4075]GAX40816.1 hypothetical protein NIES4075_17820 [Tolypothrix sp. NIES-4075]